jgi:hypothetical protein
MEEVRIFSCVINRYQDYKRNSNSQEQIWAISLICQCVYIYPLNEKENWRILNNKEIKKKKKKSTIIETI